MTDSIIAGNKEFKVRHLNSQDEDIVQQLSVRCSDFSMLIEGRLPQKNAGYEILFDLPPGKELKDKFVLGVFDCNNLLIAVIDIIRDFRNIGEWTLGLLMLDPNERGNGLGREINGYIKSFVKENGGSILRLGVVEENTRAFRFWTTMGYTEVNRVKATYGLKDHVVIVMNLCLN